LLCVATIFLATIHLLRIDIGVDDLVDLAGPVDAGGINLLVTGRGITPDKRGTAHIGDIFYSLAQRHALRDFDNRTFGVAV